MLRSQTTCSTWPPPIAYPAIIATTGFGKERICFCRFEHVQAGDAVAAHVALGAANALVASGAEGLVAGAGEDGDARSWILAHVLEALLQLEERLRAERVADLGTVDGHLGDTGAGTSRRSRPRTSGPGSTSSQCLHECLGSFEMRGVAAVRDQRQFDAREQRAHAPGEVRELLVACAGDQPHRHAQLRELIPIAGLRAGAEVAQGAGEPGGTVREPLGAKLRGEGTERRQRRGAAPIDPRIAPYRSAR